MPTKLVYLLWRQLSWECLKSNKEFFDDTITEPSLVNELYSLTKEMSKEDISVLINTAKRLNSK